MRKNKEILMQKYRKGIALGILLCVMLSGCRGIYGAGEAPMESERGSTGEDSPVNGLPQEASQEDSEADREENADDTQYPIIIQNDLTQNLDFVFMTEDIYCVDTGDTWIYITQEGEALTPDSYTVAYPFHEGLACACKEGKYGFIDTSGKTVIDFIYDRATPFVEGLAYFCKDGSYGFMDQTGGPLFYLDCDSVSTFQEGLAFISVDGKYGYIDKTGEIVVEPIYDYADYIQDGYAEVWKDSKRGIIDRTGKEIVAPEFAEVQRNQDCFVGEKGGKYYIYDLQGNALLETPCDEISTYWGEVALSYDETGTVGFVHEGKAVLFDTPYYFGTIVHDRELAIAKIDDFYWGVIDFQGEVKVPFCYTDITYKKNAGVFLVSRRDGNGDNERGFISADDFSQSVMRHYTSIGPFVNGQAAVSITSSLGEKHYGTVDITGKLIMPFNYDKIVLFENGSYWYKEDGVSYLCDADGTLLNVGGYDYIELRGDCYVTQKNNTEVGLLNAAGEEILKTVYYQYSHRTGAYGYRSGIMVLRKDFEDGYMIVGTQKVESRNDELFDVFLLNEITPRVFQFWKFIHDGSFVVEDMGPGHETAVSEWNSARNIYRIYDFGHTGKPFLYVYSKPYVQDGPGHISYSGFFTCQEEDTVCLLSGYENGGTSGGNYVCLWYDNEKEELLLGEYGHVGGFGGDAVYRSIYDYADGAISERVSLEWIGQSARNYSQEELIDNAEWYYDEREEPYTRETILYAAYIEEYSVNGELTTREQYNKVWKRYRRVSLPM